MKLLVCAGPDPIDPGFVWSCLDRADRKRAVLLLVHSDHAAALGWAEARGVSHLRVADPVLALRIAAPDGCLAFPGTPDAVVTACRAAGVPVWLPAFPASSPVAAAAAA